MDLLAEVDNLLAAFQELPLLKRYQALDKAVKESERLNRIKSQRETIQKGIKYLKDYKKDEAIKACKELQIAYDEDPLVVNRNALREELTALLSPLEEIV